MQHRQRILLVSLSLGVFLSLNLAGCAHTVYPVTTGSHALIDSANKDKKFRFVVWATHPSMASTITSFLQSAGHTVVERSRLQQVFKEQEIRLTHSSEDDAEILRVGKLLGADRVVFAEHNISSNVVSGSYFNMYGGGSQSATVYHVSVAVRAVNVETGEVRWSGSAHYPSGINNPEAGLSYLTQSAIARAVCPIETGYEWKESSTFETGGCRKKE
jgi:hypothetical protein